MFPLQWGRFVSLTSFSMSGLVEGRLHEEATAVDLLILLWGHSWGAVCRQRPSQLPCTQGAWV